MHAPTTVLNCVWSTIVASLMLIPYWSATAGQSAYKTDYTIWKPVIPIFLRSQHYFPDLGLKLPWSYCAFRFKQLWTSYNKVQHHFLASCWLCTVCCRKIVALHRRCIDMHYCKLCSTLQLDEVGSVLEYVPLLILLLHPLNCNLISLCFRLNDVVRIWFMHSRACGLFSNAAWPASFNKIVFCDNFRRNCSKADVFWQLIPEYTFFIILVRTFYYLAR